MLETACVPVWFLYDYYIDNTLRVTEMFAFNLGSAPSLLTDMFYQNSVDEMVPVHVAVEMTVRQAVENNIIKFYEIEEAENFLNDII